MSEEARAGVEGRVVPGNGKKGIQLVMLLIMAGEGSGRAARGVIGWMSDYVLKHLYPSCWGQSKDKTEKFLPSWN